MKSFTRFLAAAAAIGGVSAPLAAQSAYPYGYQQQVPQPYPGQPGYGYQQGYAQNPVGQIIDGLLGNRYNVSDRQAVSQCASAAMTQAAAQYANGYDRGYGNNSYNRGYNGAMRVTAITDVQRRNNGLRVSGTMSSGYGGNNGGQYGYQNRDYARGDISFRCNVDYRGAVTNVRIGRNMAYSR
jgi:hypothetical protein